jgi:hypothetical protein
MRRVARQLGAPAGRRPRHLSYGLGRRHGLEAQSPRVAQSYLAKFEIGCAKGKDPARRTVKGSGSPDDVDAVEVVGQDAVRIGGWKRRKNGILEKNRITRLRDPVVMDVKRIPADAQHTHADRAFQITGCSSIGAKILKR